MKNDIEERAAIRRTRPIEFAPRQRPAMSPLGPISAAPDAPLPGNGGDQAKPSAKSTRTLPDRTSPAAMPGDKTIYETQPTGEKSCRKNPALPVASTSGDPKPIREASMPTLPAKAGSAGAMFDAEPKSLPLRHTPVSDGHLKDDSPVGNAAAGDERAQMIREAHRRASPLIAEITQLVRMRRRWIKAKNSLVLQGKALCRGWTEGDKDEANKLYDAAKADAWADPMLAMALSPFFASLTPFEADIEAIEKTLAKLGKALPVWKSWGEGVKGLSALGLAIIVGECGDIGTYRNPSCLWKRMGLAVHGDHRQGNPGAGATADDWTFEAYSKVRRSVMWNIGNGLIGGMGKFRPLFGEDVEANPSYSPYQKMFAERCRYEASRLPHKDGDAIKESATGKDSYTLHAANRAKRYVEKRMLRDLYVAWRAADGPTDDEPLNRTPPGHVPHGSSSATSEPAPEKYDA